MLPAPLPWEALAEREQATLLRRRTPVDVASGGRIRVGGVITSTSLATTTWALRVTPPSRPPSRRGGAIWRRAGASPLVTGYSRAHQQLEETLADWLGVEAVLLFNCGFSANQAVLKALLGKDHLLWQDKLNHASLQEMGSQLPCKMKRFGHNDMAAPERLLEPNRGLIVSEGSSAWTGIRPPGLSWQHSHPEAATG